jgi:ABC-2 type transport system ATP-binding protein
MEVLSVKGLRKSFKSGFFSKETEVLKGLNFKVHQGKITGFLGANGAGKTTTMKCLLNLIFPDAAQISYFGERELTPEVRSRIGFLPEQPYFYDYLTGYEFLRFYGQISTRFTRAELDKKINRLLGRVNLSHAADRQLRDYSKGMLQRVGVAQALIGEPDLVILDEPMSGLDPDGRFEVNQIIRETAAEGTAVFFSSHLLHDVEMLCEDLVVLKSGKVVFEGTTRALLEQFDTSVTVTYLENQEKKVLKGVSHGEVNPLIDRLRKEGSEITEIKKEMMSLEQAFVNIAMRDTPGESHLDHN